MSNKPQQPVQPVQPKIRIWCCSVCGHVETAPNPGTHTPRILCDHGKSGSMMVMTEMTHEQI